MKLQFRLDLLTSSGERVGCKSCGQLDKGCRSVNCMIIIYHVYFCNYYYDYNNHKDIGVGLPTASLTSQLETNCASWKMIFDSRRHAGTLWSYLYTRHLSLYQNYAQAISNLVGMNIFSGKNVLNNEQERTCIFTFTVNFTLSVSDMRPKTRADEEVSSPIRSAVIPKLIIISLAWFLIFTEYKGGAVIKTCKSASSSYIFYNFSRSKENT